MRLVGLRPLLDEVSVLGDASEGILLVDRVRSVRETFWFLGVWSQEVLPELVVQSRPPHGDILNLDALLDRCGQRLESAVESWLVGVTFTVDGACSTGDGQGAMSIVLSGRTLFVVACHARTFTCTEAARV